MDAASGKSRPRKSMRVATIFTGVAACTFGAATQVANAQEAAPHAAAQTLKDAGRAIPDSAVYGSIRSTYLCFRRGINKTWLHYAAYYSYDSPVGSWCVGYKGLLESPAGVGIYSECGGNNHGLLVGTTAAGRKWSTGFGPGTTYRKLNEAHLTAIYVNSWTGNDKCGKPPMITS
jgi:hypothetical protein